ncbi:MAG: response regulator, partial [Deltaproteobacteria bacterium]
MARQKILAVDDEEDILELLRFNLAKEGFAVVCAVSGEEALKRVLSQKPDLILLDLLLPGMDGLEVARRLKKEDATKDIPVIMVTAKGEEADIVTGLEVGAEDYITKPFSRKVLIARVRAVLRRRAAGPADDQEVVTVHDLTIHPGRREVLVKGKPVSLTFTEFG